MIESKRIKPYLFPLSSMTDKQREKIGWIFTNTPSMAEVDNDGDLYFDIPRSIDDMYLYLSEMDEYITWLNKNHFDYRGLIKKGLAIDATGLNIYKEEEIKEEYLTKKITP